MVGEMMKLNGKIIVSIKENNRYGNCVEIETKVQGFEKMPVVDFRIEPAEIFISHLDLVFNDIKERIKNLISENS